MELWPPFLDRITDGNQELIDYLQRVCGYCLTGSTREHVMFFLYGNGANGKSVFTSTLLGVMNTYACVSPIEVFLESTPTGTRPSWPGCVASAWWSRRRPKRAVSGPRAASRL